MAMGNFGGLGSLCQSGVWRRLLPAYIALAAVASTTTISLADENGISFWVPGFFGSFAAAPQQPGWSVTSIYYHTDVSASGNAALAREISIGRFNPTVNINVNSNVHAIADIGFAIPTYVARHPSLFSWAMATTTF